MRHLFQNATMAGLLLAGALTACGTDDVCADEDCSFHGSCAEIYGNATCQCDAGFHADALACLPDDPPEHGTAQLLIGDLHATEDHEAQISLRRMDAGDTVSQPDLTLYEGFVGNTETPLIGLLAGVEAINLGALDEFHEVDEVPAEGYSTDGAELIIGDAFQNGGTCEGGFIMSHNVFALKLPDDTYAKLTIQTAKAGRLEFLAYRQPDGSRDTTTRP